MKNRLAEAIAKKLAKANAGIPKRLKKRSRTEELRWCAEQMGVRYDTAYRWYRNIFQPSKEHIFQLCELYRFPFSKFYYNDQDEE